MSPSTFSDWNTFSAQLIEAADDAIRRRGLAIRKRAIDFTSWTDEVRQANIMGTRLYSIVLNKKKGNVLCTCPYFSRHIRICKHIVALANSVYSTDLQEISSEEIDQQAEFCKMQLSDIRNSLAQLSSKKMAPLGKKKLLLVLNESMGGEISLHTVVVSPKQDKLGAELKNYWQKSSKLLDSPSQFLSSHDKAILSILLGRKPNSYSGYGNFNRNGYYIDYDNDIDKSFNNWLELFVALRNYDILRTINNFPITIDEALWKAVLKITPGDAGEAFFKGRLVHGEKEILTADGHCFGQGSWFFIQNKRIYFGDPRQSREEAEFILSPYPYAVKQSDFLELRQDLQNVSGVSIDESLLPIQITAEARPVLQISESQNLVLKLNVAFRYGEEAPTVDWLYGQTTFSFDLNGHAAELIRDMDEENKQLQIFQDFISAWKAKALRFDLTNWGRGCYKMNSTSALLFLRDALILLPADWEVMGEKSLFHLKLKQTKVNIGISSGEDWFDIHGELAWDGGEISLWEALEMASRDDEFIPLPGGGFGTLPRRVLKKFQDISQLGTKQRPGSTDGDDENIRLTGLQAALLLPAIQDEEVTLQKKAEWQEQINTATSLVIPKRVATPRHFDGKLREYQSDGLRWLEALRKWGVGGILADDMGLGKTIQVLCHLLRFRNKKVGPSLVVAPVSLLYNWQREAEKFTPSLKTTVYHGPMRSELCDSLLERQDDLIITSYAILRNDIDFLRQISFHYAILDESQNIKNPTTINAQVAQEINAQHRLALTGTPVENGVMDLWSQLQFCNPELFGSRAFFERRFAKPIANGDQEQIEKLQKWTDVLCLRRTKDEVLDDLPEKEDHDIIVEMKSRQRDFYDKTKERYRKKLMNRMQKEGVAKSKIYIIEGLLRLRQICCDPRLYRPSSTVKSAKLKLLISKCESLASEGHKALIFSQFTGMLDLIEQPLKKAKLDFLRLDGSTRNRQQLVDRFQSEEGEKLFLISLKAGGVGLNLTAASYVFHFDPWWNPAVQQQATDRTHRIGQVNKVQNYRLICHDTVEEKIMHMQDRKRKLGEQVIKGEGGWLRGLSPEMVGALFE